MEGAGFLVKVRGVEGVGPVGVETLFFPLETPFLSTPCSLWVWASERSMSVVQLISLSISSITTSVSMSEYGCRLSWVGESILGTDEEVEVVDNTEDEEEVVVRIVVLCFLVLVPVPSPPESSPLPLAPFLLTVDCCESVTPPGDPSSLEKWC